MGYSKYYYMHKAKGECVECGAVLPPRWGWVMCVNCRRKRMAPVNVKRDEQEEEELEVIKYEPTTLDEMSKEAKERGISYGKLQQEETIRRINARDKAQLTLKRWGRDRRVDRW